MRISIITFLILLFPKIYAQSDYQIKKYQNPIDELNDEILLAENSIKEKGVQSWVRIEKVVCLSGVKIKKVDHQYSGLSYKPNQKELKEIKTWFAENKNKLYYLTSSRTETQIIGYKNSNGVLIKSDCNYE